MQSSSPEQQTGQDTRSARRRLIRGAFGAPAALTLFSGSAAAASNCVARQFARVDGIQNPGITDSLTVDKFVRVQTRVKKSGANRSTWVWGDDLLKAAFPAPAVPPANISFLGTSDWYCLSAGNLQGSNQSGYTAGQKYTTAAMLAIDNETPALQNSSYAAMRIDVNGNIVGVTTTANATAVTGTCWSSFAPSL